MGRKTVLVLSMIFVFGALVNCGGGGGGGGTGGGGGGSLTATRIPGDYASVGPVVTDGTWLAWIAREKDQVMGHTGVSADTGSAVAALSSDDWYPNNIAYDGRYLVVETRGGTDAEIIYYDTVAGGPYVTVTDNSLNDYEPVVDDGIIVWYASDGNDEEIFYYDIADSGQGVVKLTDNTTNDRSPSVEGGKVVWYGHDGNDNEIYYYDINASAPTIVQVSDNDGLSDSSPEVDENGLIVWSHNDGNEPEIFYADMSLGATTFTPVQITNDTVWDQDVHVDGRNIVWENGNIYYCDIDAGTGTTVVMVDSPVLSNNTPSISGDRIVWQGFDGDTEIYSHVIGDPVDSILKVTDNSTGDGDPIFDGNYAVWRSYDGDSSYYVYRYDFSTSALIRLADEQYLRVMNGDFVTSGGETYWLTTSANYRLYAGPVDGSAPVRTVTPPDQEAYSVDIDDGIIAFHTWGVSNSEIYYSDLNAVSFTVIQITHDTEYSEYPAISNGVIAWEEYVDAQGNYEIFYYDINAAAPTLVQVSDTPSFDDGDVDIDNGILTWSASDGSDKEIYYADISVGASTFVVVPVTVNAIYDYYPRVDNGIITWYGNDGDYEIYYADVSAGASTFTVEQLTDNTTSDRYPEISGGVIVWEGVGSSGTDNEIWYADVSAGAVVEELTSNDLNDGYPVITDGLITWYADGDDTDSEIYYYDLNAASPAVTQVTDNLVDDYYPVSAGGLIAWYTALAPYIVMP